MKIKDNFEQRKVMWTILSKLFHERNMLEFVWMFSEDDREASVLHPDGFMPGLRGMSGQFTVGELSDN